MPLALEVRGLATGYDQIEVLHDVNLWVPEGSVVALLGPNGMGKTTLLRAIAGLLPAWRGSVWLAGRRIDGMKPSYVAAEGVTLIPEGRGVFPGLSVSDNLEIASRAARRAPPSQRAATLDRVLEYFPRLRERRDQKAGTLSGGEQQMLALSRAFLAEPQVLLLDEISIGLAPIVVEQLFETVAALKADGQTIVLVEQYVTYALQQANLCYLLHKGRVSFAGEPCELRRAGVVAGAYLQPAPPPTKASGDRRHRRPARQGS